MNNKLQQPVQVFVNRCQSTTNFYYLYHRPYGTKKEEVLYRLTPTQYNSVKSGILPDLSKVTPIKQADAKCKNRNIKIHYINGYDHTADYPKIKEEAEPQVDEKDTAKPRAEEIAADSLGSEQEEPKNDVPKSRRRRSGKNSSNNSKTNTNEPENTIE